MHSQHQVCPPREVLREQDDEAAKVVAIHGGSVLHRRDQNSRYEPTSLPLTHRTESRGTVEPHQRPRGQVHESAHSPWEAREWVTWMPPQRPCSPTQARCLRLLAATIELMPEDSGHCRKNRRQTSVAHQRACHRRR